MKESNEEKQPQNDPTSSGSALNELLAFAEFINSRYKLANWWGGELCEYKTSSEELVEAFNLHKNTSG